ncbi:hypothetical protein AG0111_0g7873 [Alternaria gaisen]|uniref:Uncharacterized protein n=1 Tax=Alternaria gaisen TaxID=167740 RepID=A0ACB6FHH4_9PLEO|nr:hypothetical protein AG0111_0g7873 [Alternaria gaisen]
MSSIYEAVPLDRDISSTNIRVIENLVRDKEGRISCNLRTISLECKDDERRSQRPESYLALSYAWGPPNAGKSISIDGKSFEVRDNLWDFLNEACTRGTFTRKTTFTGEDWRNVFPGTYIPEEKQVYLWIDATCIDQSQMEERNHQVAMMGKIYSRAQKVLVWLGRPTPLIAELLHDIQSLKIDENLRFVWKAIDDHGWVGKRSWWVGKRSWSVGKRSGLEELCKIDYWERLWVVQEYLLAKSVDMWCGTDSVDPEKIKWLVCVVFQTSRLENSCAMRLLQGRKVRNVHAEQLSLKRHLDDFGMRMKCADVRDRVYGLLALINEKEREKLEIRPDYALSPLDLYRKLRYALRASEYYTPVELWDYAETLRLALGLTLDDVEDTMWMAL